MEHFGDQMTATSIESLAALRQVGIVEEYTNELWARAAQIHGLDSSNQLGTYLNGLKQEIRVRLRPADVLNCGL